VSRVFREVAALTGLVLFAVLAILLIGQTAQIGQILLSAGSPRLWWDALSGGALILLEAALPLAGLLGAGLAYGRLRSEDAWIARAALGGSPWRAMWPAIAVGLLLGLGAGLIARETVPRTVDGLRGTLVTAIAVGLETSTEPVRLPDGTVAARLDDGSWWAVVPDRRDPTLVSAASIRLEPGTGSVVLRDARMSNADLHIEVAEARLPAPLPALRRLAMLGPPNALTSARLDPDDVHHRFTWHRRWAVPAMAPLWALLGALLGARFGGPPAIASGAACVALAYWFLRTGELTARAGFMSPVLAAWAPALVLGLVLLWVVCRDPSLARPAR